MRYPTMIATITMMVRMSRNKTKPNARRLKNWPPLDYSQPQPSEQDSSQHTKTTANPDP
jgi:hypothetical protein